jgi:hypothetical protein
LREREREKDKTYIDLRVNQTVFYVRIEESWPLLLLLLLRLMQLVVFSAAIAKYFREMVMERKNSEIACSCSRNETLKSVTIRTFHFAYFITLTLDTIKI